jgi:cytochrome c oxidase assembly protein subunit 15
MLVAKSSIAGRVFALLVFLQGALIVTGGAVRVTGSGLGCPTWPECTPGSYTPVPGQAEGALHAWIEFGNRLLTFVLLITALAAVIFSIKYSKNLLNKVRIRTLALLQVLGILGQGVLGGITVLTDLHPLPVAGHFLLSIFLISGAISLRYEVVGVVKEPALGLAKPILPLLIWLTLFVLIAGTIVTGSGPHAGDEQAQRFGFDPRVVSWLHADLVIALLVLTSMLFLITRQLGLKMVNKRVGLFLFICFAQGLVGYVQYFTGLPVVLVAIHLLGATLVWVSGWSLVKVADSGFRLKGFHL